MGVYRLFIHCWSGDILITTSDQPFLTEWLCSKIGLTPTKDIRCIGSILRGELRGVVGYDNYNGASIMMHVAGEEGWLTRDVLWAVFDYPFNVCKVNMVIGLVPSGNEPAIRFNTHIGFKTETVLTGAHPDGALVLMTMRRGECRFLTRKRHGQEVKAAASA